ncbi:unnamed protein product [Lactuca virosa]|uniref:AAA+ ATPase domain-containing protein n=1 Tax=Lactuca virosa TaxID=75947 RepID=A0AAU9LWE1_9ASTR|nr:unnamed protein product [Lactuca virosa]
MVTATRTHKIVGLRNGGVNNLQVPTSSDDNEELIEWKRFSPSPLPSPLEAGIHEIKSHPPVSPPPSSSLLEPPFFPTTVFIIYTWFVSRSIAQQPFVKSIFHNLVGRQPQIERVTQILGRRTKNNPCLIGEPGVGKTAIAEGFAQRIANGDVPETIEGKKVITLDMGLLVAGTKYRGEFEERLKKLMEEIKQSDEIILFIDEVHTLIGAGAAEGAIDAANILNMQASIGP